MTEERKSIAVVAPARRLDDDVPEKVQALSAATFGEHVLRLDFHPQCFACHGHFAGDDQRRAEAFIQVANDPTYDAVWFAKGGYGSNRILDQVIAGLGAGALNKAYLGYSDLGFLLGALYRAGFDRAGGGQIAHGPMVSDITREGGEAAIIRALTWLAAPSDLKAAPNPDGLPRAAFNITVLSHLVGSDHAPDLSGHVLYLEDVGEYEYRLDRALFHILTHPSMAQLAGVRLGRVSHVPENDVPFGVSPEEIVRHWCAQAGIAFLGNADIGHDSDNAIIAFG
ncbi:MAG: LD-carboxypeptidase [Pseudomonadota bacterium]